MTALSLVSDTDLLERMPHLVLAERGCTADVIVHLMEIDRRRIYLDAACRSLFRYCIERLGYSEDEAGKRVRDALRDTRRGVAELARRIPQALEELRSGAIHLTGLWLLAPVLTGDNAANLLASARGNTRGQIEELIVRHFPKPDAPERVCPEPEQLAMLAPSRPNTPTNAANAAKPAKVAPLSESRWSVQLSIGGELKAKIDEARQLLSHAVPNGDLATLVERAFDALLAQEKKRRFGAGKPRKRRLSKPGSRHIPIELVREVTERDGGQCTFVDEKGNRCSAREQLTIEHRHPFALGGATTATNLCLLCAAHNRHTARKAFGQTHVEQKILEAEYERTHAALCKMGFREKEARTALAGLKSTSRATSAKELLVEALAVLVPAAQAAGAPTKWTVRDSVRPRWSSRAPCTCPGTDLTIHSCNAEGTGTRARRGRNGVEGSVRGPHSQVQPALFDLHERPYDARHELSLPR
jgi:5-methylcytosine-specific restriction endonuclease McrA